VLTVQPSCKEMAKSYKYFVLHCVSCSCMCRWRPVAYYDNTGWDSI